MGSILWFLFPVNITIGVWGAEGVEAFFSVAFSAGFGVSLWAFVSTAAGVTGAAGVGTSFFCSCLGSSLAGFVEVEVDIADLSSSYSIKSAPTSILLDSWTNNFFIIPAPSDLISTLYYYHKC